MSPGVEATGPNSVVAITQRYEAWMRSKVPYVQEKDLEHKHDQMAGGNAAAAFRFLRGTFYLWSYRLREELPHLVDDSVPTVLGVGDLHLENFGTWRDGEGRLVWGVNDLDEATLLPYTQDLVRLAASAELADLDIGGNVAAPLILDGYRSNLEHGGRAFVLAEADTVLWKLARDRTADPLGWWQQLDDLVDTVPGLDSSAAARIIAEDFPAADVGSVRWGTRQAGIGSLGRPRVTAIGLWYGSRIAREAKFALPSAWDWAVGGVSSPPSGGLFDAALRAPDPFARVVDNWSVRRLAPDSEKIAVDDIASAEDQQHLLAAMGRELANVHLATANVPAVLAHLPGSDQWLVDAAGTMVESVRHDQRRYREHRHDH